MDEVAILIRGYTRPRHTNNKPPSYHHGFPFQHSPWSTPAFELPTHRIVNFRLSAHNRPNAPTMRLFSYIRSIYALDTIDTRFTSSSSVPYKPAPEAQGDAAQRDPKKDGPPRGVPVRLDGNGKPIVQPSKWNTPEFYFYYFVFLITVPYMFWIAYDVSRR
jgi:hypothetical protein